MVSVHSSPVLPFLPYSSVLTNGTCWFGLLVHKYDTGMSFNVDDAFLFGMPEKVTKHY